jgi:hypothetical protein
VNDPMTTDYRSVLGKLLEYCRASDFAGYDPYDALNSRLLAALPFLDFRLPRLALTQLNKRSPVNLRPLLLIPKTKNPKALGLFLSAAVKLSRAGVVDPTEWVERLIQDLIQLRAPNREDWCWGYSFPWQTRREIVPAGSPNLVCTMFVADGLLDAYEQWNDSRCRDMAVSAAGYIAEKLFWTEGAVASFSYPLPAMKARVHNANFLAAALLCRVYRHTGREALRGPALSAARYSAAQQRADGSWLYGDAPTQNWIDNFHTGFNLCALRSIGQSMESAEFEPNVTQGFHFYRDHFFREDRAPRYFHDETYPIDIHCVAQSIITLLTFNDLDPASASQAEMVFRWAMKHMWDKRGYFYYRVLRSCTIKTSYMRWSQSWMMLALSMLVLMTRTERH